MYKIQAEKHGFTLTFGGSLYSEELLRWLEDSKCQLAQHNGPFGVIVDMRGMLPLGTEARAIILRGQDLYRKGGLVRSAVILKGFAITAQFRQLAKDSMVYRNERYIDASDNEECLKQAHDWVTSEVDPGQSK